MKQHPVEAALFSRLDAKAPGYSVALAAEILDRAARRSPIPAMYIAAGKDLHRLATLGHPRTLGPAANDNRVDSVRADYVPDWPSDTEAPSKGEA